MAAGDLAAGLPFTADMRASSNASVPKMHVWVLKVKNDWTVVVAAVSLRTQGKGDQ